ncbi:hypothetical protein ZWY2020_043276 [Hordeum vulgare]|nr:hypothetical protein ZWY2020_043276 [Hordeum vulgare]
MEKAGRKSSPSWTAAVALVFLFAAVGTAAAGAHAPRRILVDTDMDTDDLFALLYILKQDRSQLTSSESECSADRIGPVVFARAHAITINANAWIDAGHGVNQLYDILYMMGRDDIAVGVGGDGGISDAGEIRPDVGGYLPLIDQGMSTAAGCRYRQAILPGRRGGRLDTDTNGGLRRLPSAGTLGYAPPGSPRRSR